MGRDSSKYELGARIGGGGMAEVYRGTLRGAEGFARSVAIKRMLGPLSADLSFAEMFINEARIASLLAHSNIVSVLDFDRDSDDQLFIVMELVEGKDLRQLMQTGPIPVHVTAHVIAEVLRALAFAHDLEHQGRPLSIVHRDVSPHNVMLSWDGAVKLSDFGIAKAIAASGASRTGTLKGKVGYMSPEQAHGLALDGRSDVFAVGVMFHELLTGRRLFGGATEAEVLSRMLAQPIVEPTEINPDVTPELDWICMQMLARDRDQRFGSAHAALEALLNSNVMSARGTSELAILLRARFPAEAPSRTGRSAAESTGPLSRSRSGASLATDQQSSAASGPTMAAPQPPPPTERRHAMDAATRTVHAADSNPPGTLDRPLSSFAAEPRPNGSGRHLWIAAAAIAVLVIGVGTVLATRNSGSDAASDLTAAALVTKADAGITVATAPTAEPDAAPAREPEPDGSPAVAVIVPPDAGVDRPASRSHSSRSKKRRAAERAAQQPPESELVKPPAAAPDDKPRSEPPPSDESSRDKADREPATVRLYCDPWADVYVDGKRNATGTPVTLTLKPGRHKIILRNDELGKRSTKRFKLKPGERTSYRCDW